MRFLLLLLLIVVLGVVEMGISREDRELALLLPIVNVVVATTAPGAVSPSFAAEICRLNKTVLPDLR